MKTIFIALRDGEVSKSVLRSDIAPLLVAGGVRLVLFVPKDRREYYDQEFGSPSVSIRLIPEPTFPRLEDAFAGIFLNSLHTESVLIKMTYARATGGSFFAFLAKRGLWFLGQWYPVRWFWRKLYACIPDRSFDGAFCDLRPDLVFAANLISNEDVRLVKAARRFGVHSIGMPKGWDNLTIKTFLANHPDHLLVQTPLLKEDAKRLDMPHDRMTVVGFPKFDVYARRTPRMSREEFFQSMGFDPAKKLILYAGAGTDLAPHDEEILSAFLEAASSGSFAAPVQVLVRPHPKYAYRAEVLPPSEEGGIRWKLDRPGKKVGAASGSFEFDEADILHLMNSLAHCDLLIHTASTLGVEAAIFDTPILSIAYDPISVPAEASVARYYRYEHLSRVVQTGGMRLVRNFAELLEFTNEYLTHPEHDRVGRLRIVEENTFRLDGKAAERTAQALLINL